MVIAVMQMAMLCGCASNEPKMSGFGLGQSRIVSVNDLIELRIPLRQDGSRQWRVTSYDSTYLAIIRAPTLTQTSSGEYEILTIVRAKLPGETTVSFVEITPPGERAPRTIEFSITIVQ